MQIKENQAFYPTLDQGSLKTASEALRVNPLSNGSESFASDGPQLSDLKQTSFFNERSAGVSFDSDSGRLYLTIYIDGERQKVLREIPPDEVRDLAQRLEKMTGLILDKYL